MAPDTSTAAAFIPPRPTLAKLQEAAAGCTACDLYSILRGPPEARDQALQGLTSDLARVAEGLRQLG